MPWIDALAAHTGAAGVSVHRCAPAVMKNLLHPFEPREGRWVGSECLENLFPGVCRVPLPDPRNADTGDGPTTCGAVI